MKKQNSLPKIREYIHTFNPVVVPANVQHQDYLYSFNAGDEYKNFNEFIQNEWEEYQDIFWVIDGEERPISVWILHDIIQMIESLTTSTVAAKAIFLHAVPNAEKFYLQNGFNYTHPSMHASHSLDSEYRSMFLALVELHIHYDK